MEGPKVNSMGKKERTGIYIDRDVKKRAIELGLNISQVCENALKALILTVNSTFKKMGQGFEPGGQATQGLRRPRLAYRPVSPAARDRSPTPALKPSILAPNPKSSQNQPPPVLALPQPSRTRIKLKSKEAQNIAKHKVTGYFGEICSHGKTQERALRVFRLADQRGQLHLGEAAFPAGHRGRNQVGEAEAADQVRLPSTWQVIPVFRRFLEVDLQRKRLTVNGHAQTVGRFLQWLGDRPVTRDVLRDYLDQYRGKAESTYANQLKSLKVFFRDYLGRPELVSTFQFPGKELELKRIPKTEKVQGFYRALKPLDPRIPCFYLLYASSGWRRREVMALHREDVDLESRMMTHRVASSATKGRLIGMMNQEAAELLRQYLATRRDRRPTLLPITERTFRRLWSEAAQACGFLIQPQDLRDWFCEEMGRLGVADRYIDAFCGRVPKSVLAKHYTDYAPEKLKAIYDKAGLRVLS